MEWFTENVWALWLALGLVLATAELLTLDLTLILLSTGAFAACLVSLAVPDMLWLQALVGAAVSCSTLFFLRPSLLAKFRNAPGYRSQLENVIGSAATATSLITKDGGTIKVDGQTWSARTALPGQIIQSGENVVVGSIDGVTAVVSTTRQQLY